MGRLRQIGEEGSGFHSNESQIFRIKNLCTNLINRPDLVCEIIRSLKQGLYKENLLLSVDILCHLTGISVHVKCMVVESQILDSIIERLGWGVSQVGDQMLEVVVGLTICIESICEMDFRTKNPDIEFGVFDVLSRVVVVYSQIPQIYLVEPKDLETITGDY